MVIPDLFQFFIISALKPAEAILTSLKQISTFLGTNHVSLKTKPEKLIFRLVDPKYLEKRWEIKS